MDARRGVEMSLDPAGRSACATVYAKGHENYQIQSYRDRASGGRSAGHGASSIPHCQDDAQRRARGQGPVRHPAAGGQRGRGRRAPRHGEHSGAFRPEPSG
ncbi:hypothetical protein SBA6_240003 [Candidatus Sulfopaludibacter sp. SbA6]|nr:hypothetical protein SBA6_240003 [Candidatus Sulfopaludibacter sp. SbA6]